MNPAFGAHGGAQHDGPRVHSLRQRLRRVLLVLLGGLVLQWIIADRMIVHVGESEMATRLQHDSDSLIASFDIDAANRLVFDAERAGIVYTRPYSGHYFVIDAGAERFRSPSFAESRPFAAAASTPQTLAHLDGPREQPLLVLYRPLNIGSTHIDLAVGEDLTQILDQLRGFRLVFLGICAALAIAALLLQDREIRNALLPLERIRERVLQIPRGQEKSIAIDAPSEIQPLVDEINRLLDFVRRRLEQSRTAIGNLSHAVKTPLTAVIRLLEDPRLAALPDLRTGIGEQAECIRERIERELKRARLAGDQPTQAHFAAREELPALVQLLRRIHRDRGLAIEWRAPAEPVPYDRQDMLELLGNLADNACKWAERRVDIDIARAGEWTITVADDGPGCTPEVVGQLGTRGRRADETRPGYGLGLAIVRDIAEHAGGSVELAGSGALGGLAVTVRLPA
jgi:signal transduction histidine kinase